MFTELLTYKQRERQDSNLQPSAPQADALSNYATLSKTSWRKTVDSNHKPYFGSICLANSAHPLMRLLSILSVFRQLKGSGGSRTHSVKELRFYRPLSAPIEADPLAVATGIEPASTQLKAVRLYQFAYATSKVLY